MLSNDEFSDLAKVVAETFPNQKLDLDAYFFMEGDIRYLLKGSGSEERLPALHFLGNAIDEKLEEIVQCVLRSSGSRAPVALTSFLPEISQYVHREAEQRIVSAIVGLFKLAVQIGMSSGQTPVVQMVAGNMLDRVDRRKKSSKTNQKNNGQELKQKPQRNRFYIVEADENASYEMVLRRLSECFEILHREFEGQTKKLIALEQLRIAFELEPGPLYLLDGPMSVVRFCHLIEQHPDPLIQKHVGFNLDVAHWWLKNIKPEFLDRPLDYLAAEIPSSKGDPIFQKAPPSIRDRIFHSHISGHSRRAHFGDISLTMLSKNDRDSYLQWLSALDALSEDEDTDFSGYVSLEFEAARSRTCVVDSICELFRMVDEVTN